MPKITTQRTDARLAVLRRRDELIKDGRFYSKADANRFIYEQQCKQSGCDLTAFGHCTFKQFSKRLENFEARHFRCAIKEGKRGYTSQAA